MPLRRTQRDIVDLYRGNLGYFRKLHYLRRIRLWLFLGGIVASLAVMGIVHWRGKETAFSTGPLSQNHARFAEDCRACHLDGNATQLASAVQSALLMPSTSQMDRACLQCHALQQIHVPQATALTLQDHASSLVVAHATDCALCHREHAGPLRMAAPDSATCLTCHAHEAALTAARKTYPLGTKPRQEKAENLTFPDGLIHFIAPRNPDVKLAAFQSTDAGHPPFGYEQPGLADPAKIRYNHQRHERADLPEVHGHKMNCADCHELGPGGIAFQPIKYERHCATCHSLQIQPTLPRLTIPHGDSEKVRYFLAGLNVSFEYAIRAEGATDPVAIARRVETEKTALQRRGILSQADLEERVFFQGDPRDDTRDRRSRGTSAGKFLTECAKCHTVAPGTPTQAPKVERPRIASHWLEKGTFTHEPHQHMNCADCHGAVHESTQTTDILLPPQRICAECHRSPAAQTDVAGLMAPAQPGGGGSALAATQRASGGVRWGCTTCHSFHSPADAQVIIESLLRPAVAAGKASASK